MGYSYTGCMLGRAPQTKETLLNFFCENMDPDKWDTTVWYRVSQNPQEFREFTGCQQDPRIWGVTVALTESAVALIKEYRSTKQRVLKH